MPILNVKIVGDIDYDRNELAQKIADKAGEILETASGQTWVKLEFLPKCNYAENGKASSELTPVFIEILKRHNPTNEEKEKISMDLATNLSNVLNRPKENIHIYFLPEGFERMAFGGVLVK